MRGRKVLVTGGAGFIGAPLVKALAEAGAIVTATLYRKDPEHVPGVKYLEADLCTREDWTLALTAAMPEIVFNCAGVTAGSGGDPLNLVTDNALIHLHMYRAMKEFGVRRVVGLSSTTGYPNSPKQMREDEYFDGDVHPAYFHPGHTRRFLERLSAMYSIETVWARVGGVYGPGDDYDPVTSHVIPALIRKVAERQDPIVLWGDGHEYRDAIHIDDMVRALMLMGTTEKVTAFNLGTEAGMTVNEILHTLLAHTGHQPRIERDMSTLQMIERRALNCAMANVYLGWNYSIPMREGLRKTLDWYEARK